MDRPSEDSTPPSWRSAAPSALVLGGLALLLALQLLAIGLRTRWIADDYIMAVEARERGVPAAGADHYRQWSGRYGATTVILTVVALGPSAAGWFASGVLAVTLGAGGLAAYRWSGSAPAATALVLALAFILAWIPEPQQTLFWVAGAATYTLPFALALLWLAWRASGAAASGRKVALAGLVCTFLIAGFSETLTVALLVALSFAFLLDRSRKLEWAFCGVGCAAGAAVVALAPGNQVRASHFGNDMTLPAVAGRWFDVIETLVRWELWYWIVAVMVLGFYGGAHLERTLSRKGYLAGAVGVLAAAISLLPSAAIIGRVPGRVLAVAHILFLLSAMGVFVVLGSRRGLGSRRWVKEAVLAGIAVLVFVLSQPRVLVLAEAVAVRAEIWEALDRSLRSEAAREGGDVALRVPRHLSGLVFVSNDPAHEMNRAIASWYGVESVRSVR